MDDMVDILYYLGAGGAALVDYLSAHVLLCLIPALFIAGALSALLNKEAITKYLGPDTPKHISYPIAAVAGSLLAVCSCTILPLFAGIWKKGAGLGPAITFLITGPAINILAITLTGQRIGWDIAGARFIMAIIIGITVGIIMTLIFESRKKGAPLDEAEGCAVPDVGKAEEQKDEKVDRKFIWLFVLLFMVLISGTLPIPLLWRLPFVALFTALAAVWALKSYPRDENKQWMDETWFFTRTILPLLLAGVFIAGILTVLIPGELIVNYVGDNSVRSNAITTTFGILMYFPTLVEVPVAHMFLDLGMARGPLLAYLLSGPTMSLQSIFVVQRLMGTKRVLVYVGLMFIFCILAGLIYGWVFG